MWRRLCEMWSGLLFKLRSATTLYVTSAMVENDRYYYRYLWTKTQSLQHTNKTSYLIYRCVEKCEHFQVVSSFMVPLRGSYIKFVWMNQIFFQFQQKERIFIVMIVLKKIGCRFGESKSRSLFTQRMKWKPNKTKPSQAKMIWMQRSELLLMDSNLVLQFPVWGSWLSYLTCECEASVQFWQEYGSTAALLGKC